MVLSPCLKDSSEMRAYRGDFAIFSHKHLKYTDRLTTAIAELEELEAQLTLLSTRKNAISRDHEEWVEELCDLSSLRESRLPPLMRQVQLSQQW